MAALPHDPVEDLQVFRLPVKGLGHLGALNGFLGKGVDVGVFVGNRLPGPALLGLNQKNKEGHYRQAGYGNPRQRRAHLEHKDDNKHHVDDLDDEVQDAVGQRIGHRVHIVDHPHQDFSVRAVVIIGEGQILQVVKEVLAQVIHNVLAHLGHNHGAQGVKADVHQNGHGQQAAQPQEQLHILVGNGNIHGLLDEHGAGKADDAAHGAEHQGRDHQPLIAGHIDHDFFQVFQVKWAFQLFVYVKTITRQQVPPPRCCSAGPRCCSNSRAAAAALHGCPAQ